MDEPKKMQLLMDRPKKVQLLVDGLGVLAFLRDLCVRSLAGDQEAGRALFALRTALEGAGELCNQNQGRDLGSGGGSYEERVRRGREIEGWVRDLCERADRGDPLALDVLSELRTALEAATALCGRSRPLTEDEYTVLREGLLIVLEAAEGRSELPREELQVIAEQTANLSKKLGCRDVDISFLEEGN